MNNLSKEQIKVLEKEHDTEMQRRAQLGELVPRIQAEVTIPFRNLCDEFNEKAGEDEEERNHLFSNLIAAQASNFFFIITTMNIDIGNSDEETIDFLLNQTKDVFILLLERARANAPTQTN